MFKAAITAFVMAVIIASPAESKPLTRSEKIAEARVSLESSADEAAIAFWNEKREVMDRFNITMDYNRRFGRWMMSAFSIGLCEDYAKPSLVADWMGKMDGFSTVLGVGFNEIRRSIESNGMRLRREGQQNSVNDSMDTATASRFCDIELEAVRQVLMGI